jgi:hypothetical protein
LICAQMLANATSPQTRKSVVRSSTLTLNKSRTTWPPLISALPTLLLRSSTMNNSNNPRWLQLRAYGTNNSQLHQFRDSKSILLHGLPPLTTSWWAPTSTLPSHQTLLLTPVPKNSQPFNQRSLSNRTDSSKTFVSKNWQPSRANLLRIKPWSSTKPWNLNRLRTGPLELQSNKLNSNKLNATSLFKQSPNSSLPLNTLPNNPSNWPILKLDSSWPQLPASKWLVQPPSRESQPLPRSDLSVAHQPKYQSTLRKINQA